HRRRLDDFQLCQPALELDASMLREPRNTDPFYIDGQIDSHDRGVECVNLEDFFNFSFYFSGRHETHIDEFQFVISLFAVSAALVKDRPVRKRAQVCDELVVKGRSGLQIRCVEKRVKLARKSSALGDTHIELLDQRDATLSTSAYAVRKLQAIRQSLQFCA